jgi:putative FmdB family regulatory protein
MSIVFMQAPGEWMTGSGQDIRSQSEHGRVVATLTGAMPLYEYRCNDCATTFELLRPMAQREVAAVCPSCESVTTMPLISRVAVHAGNRSSASAQPARPREPARGGGCCGGSCGCG